MYHILDTHLRVCSSYLRQDRNIEALKQMRLIILQHLLEDTKQLLELLKNAGADIFAVIAKPYSIDKAVLRYLKDANYNIIETEYAILEEAGFLDKLLEQAIEQSKVDKKKITILEVGGYFAQPLSRLKDEYFQYFAGVVEDTTFGHRRYQDTIDKIMIPVTSVARSPLKEIEARYVGESVVTAMDQVLREVGVTISSRNALVIGYGMIGKNVAFSLKARNVLVSVYDIEDKKNIDAFCTGFKIHKKLELLHNADIIFSATGNNAISIKDIQNCRNSVILASAGSKDIEFSVKDLKEYAFSKKTVTEFIDHYKLATGNDVFLVKNGTAVNFIIKSVPNEVIDLVFAEIILSAVMLYKTPEKYPLNKINFTPNENLNQIAKEWLIIANK